MAVFLDGIPIINEEGKEDTTVQVCFETLFAYCCEEKRAIDKAVIDGKQVNIQALSQYYNICLKDIERIEFFTIDKAELFEKLVKFGKDFVEIAEELENVGTLINEGKDLDALMVLKTASELTHNLLFYHRYFALFDLPLQYPVGDSNILEYKDKINPLFTKILDAFQAKDTVEFSDLAEYELAPIIRELGEGLQDLTL